MVQRQERLVRSKSGQVMCGAYLLELLLIHASPALFDLNIRKGGGVAFEMLSSLLVDGIP